MLSHNPTMAATTHVTWPTPCLDKAMLGQGGGGGIGIHGKFLGTHRIHGNKPWDNQKLKICWWVDALECTGAGSGVAGQHARLRLLPVGWHWGARVRTLPRRSQQCYKDPPDTQPEDTRCINCEIGDINTHHCRGRTPRYCVADTKNA